MSNPAVRTLMLAAPFGRVKDGAPVYERSNRLQLNPKLAKCHADTNLSPNAIRTRLDLGERSRRRIRADANSALRTSCHFLASKFAFCK
jgi:hypothetical protein